MPTNVTAEYRRAEQAFRAAREPRERLACLKEMLSTIPKHKGTEHVQADIKTRIKQLTEQIAGPRKKGGRTAPTYSVRPAGAGQIVLLGPPNAGKSALHARLTGSFPGREEPNLASLFKRGTKYWIAYCLDGKHVQKSLRTGNERVARAKKKQIEYELSIGDFHQSSQLLPTTVIKEFCRHLEVRPAMRDAQTAVGLRTFSDGP